MYDDFIDLYAGVSLMHQKVQTVVSCVLAIPHKIVSQS